MEIMEIIKDAALYPINNVKALVIYAVLMIVAVLVLAFSGVGLIGATDAAALGILGIIGIIIALAIFILIAGYMLDVIKIGINREDGAPEIDAKRQIINGIKFIILAIIYLIIPFIIMAILSSISETLGLIVGLILCIIFAILLVIAMCRFAKTESLGEGLNFSEVIGDLKEIGIVKVLAIIILVSIIAYILSAIGTGISGISETIGSIITAILSIYITFFQNRAYGLLYSDAE